MIYAIGDSHAAFFSGEEKMQPCWPERSNDILPFFGSIRIGPATAYQLGSKKNIINQVISEIQLLKDDKLMFCFGEVDIRAHLVKKYLLNDVSIEYVVMECVDRYINALLYYKKYKKEIIIWGPIASWSSNKIYKGPSFGDNFFRNKVSELFNQYLESEAYKNGFQFITFFYDMLNSDFSTNDYFLDDWEDSHIHLSQNAMPFVIKKFKNKNLI